MSSLETTAPPRAEAAPAPRSRTAVAVLEIFVLAVFLLPSVLVLPGALRSNGSPAVMIALACGLVVAVAFVTGRIGAGLGGGPAIILVAGALTLVTAVAGLIRPLDPDTRAGVIRGLISLLAYSGVALFTMLTMHRGTDRRSVVVVLVAGLSYSGVIGLLQSIGRGDYRYLLKPPGFVLNREFEPILRSGYTRAIGTSDSPIEFAVLMACLIALSLYLYREANGPAVQLLAFAGLVIGLLGVPASVSRTGVICVAAVFVIYFLVSNVRQIVVLIMGTALLLATFILLVPSRADELTKLFTQASKDDSVTGRTDDYAVVFTKFGHAPFFGEGLGTNLPSTSGYLDNQWLQAIVQGGLTGVASLVIIFGGAIGMAIAAVRRAAPSARAEAVAYLSVIVAIFAASFTFDLFGFAQVKYLLFVVIGLVFASLRRTRA